MNDLTSTPLPRLPPRDPRSHKGDYGRAMIVGGSRGMSGAVAMAGLACLRSGAGLVTLAVPQSVQSTVAAQCPAYMTQALVEDEHGHIHWANTPELESIANRFDAWAVGPGLSCAEQASDLVGRMYGAWLTPLVVDADGLNALALYERTHEPILDKPAAPRILTPHPGEFARLAHDPSLGEMACGSDDQRLSAAAELANRDDTSSTIVVLKGHNTIITDGKQYAINPTGNPGMATGGSGDVLTGMVTALLCQDVAPFDAARLATFVHGRTGDLAAAALGQVSLIATDLIDYLPAALQSLSSDT